ncbi:MAG: preprotein translocase subunit SecG [Candidatus Pacebacteria bacterium CG10_big_fil_rev_8_21_14_0_10_56_10]|nr:MAG: preprotein translocase subunit SecG [Candidatus Pacebacteria bacterium CG10_big_fil_rev_8_21_14_0_10_56_10]
MREILLIAQIVLAVVITASVLLQSQGSGLGAAWGGGGETYHTKRGLEKVLMYLTIISIILFVFVSLGFFLI